MARRDTFRDSVDFPVRRRRRWRHVLLRLRFPYRARTLAVLIGILTVAVLLLATAWGIADYGSNLAINLGADLIGAIVTIFVITPIISRVEEGRVREHPKLHYPWYVDQVSGATSAVRILDTFSNLLDGPWTGRFFEAVTAALERHAVVQILLLDPLSMAAVQRARELGDPDVQREILRNLRALHEFKHSTLPQRLRRSMEIRLYAVSPSIALYRWDDKALVSFVPIGRLSGKTAQLEVTVDSPLGEFVNQRFNELWVSGRDFEEFMRLPVTLVGTGSSEQHFLVDFVALQNRYYVVDSRVVARMARSRRGQLLAYVHNDSSTLYELDIVDEAEPDLHARLAEEYAAKYGGHAEVLVSLRPVREDVESLVAGLDGQQNGHGEPT